MKLVLILFVTIGVVCSFRIICPLIPVCSFTSTDCPGTDIPYINMYNCTYRCVKSLGK